MKILYFHQHFSTPEGTVGIRSYEMAKALVANGHEVTMVCGSYKGGNTGLTSAFSQGIRSGVVDGVEVIEFELNYANDQSFWDRTKAFLSFALKSIKLALTKEYDLLFATTTPLTAALPGIFAKLLRRKTFVFEVRDLWPELPKAMGVITNPLILAAMAILEKLAYKLADQHIALSPGIQTGIAKHLSEKHKAERDIALIPNGCDLQIFSNPVGTWQPNAINNDDFVALFSGTHGIANNLDSLIDVAIELRRRKIDKIKLVLIGQGKLKPALIERTKKESLKNIVFLEPVDKYKLAQLIKRADVGLQILSNIPAFYYGTSPNKFFDYISAGLPVINNYPGWIADLLSENKCGIAVPPDDPAALADALSKLSEDSKECNLMSNNSAKLARNSFSRELLSKQFVKHIEKAVFSNV